MAERMHRPNDDEYWVAPWATILFAGDVFQARATAAPTAAPPLCTLLTPQLGGIPCVNPTANGFTAKSGLARKK